MLIAIMAAPARAQAPSHPPIFELPTTGSQPNTLQPFAPPSAKIEGGFYDPEAGPAEDRVVGGRPASREAWPSIVLVRISLPDGRGSTCGGSVIAAEWVLTAAHCAVGRRAENIVVIEGTVDLKTGGRRIPVSQIIVHEGYRDTPVPHNDVALLRLSSRAGSPAQTLVSQRSAISLLPPGRVSSVAGFGLSRPQPIQGPQSGSASDRLLEVDLPVVERSECHRILSRHYRFQLSDFVDAATVCAGDARGGKDSCNGDSGGPLVVSAQGQRAVQVGVVSWGPGCAQRDTVGVYAAVAHFEDWIRQRVPGAVFYPVPTAQPGTATPAPFGNSLIASIESAAAAIGGRVDIRVDLVEGNRPRVGSTVRFRVNSPIGGQLLVYNVDLASNSAYQVFPNRHSGGIALTGTKLQIVAGEIVTVPKASDSFDIRVKEPAGKNRLYAFVLPPSIRIEDLAAKGMDMSNIPDSQSLFNELADRALRGVEISARPGSDRGAAVYEYEIVR